MGITRPHAVVEKGGMRCAGFGTPSPESIARGWRGSEGSSVYSFPFGEDIVQVKGGKGSPRQQSSSLVLLVACGNIKLRLQRYGYQPILMGIYASIIPCLCLARSNLLLLCHPGLYCLLQRLRVRLAKDVLTEAGWEVVAVLPVQGVDLLKNILGKLKH